MTLVLVVEMAVLVVDEARDTVRIKQKLKFLEYSRETWYSAHSLTSARHQTVFILSCAGGAS